MANFKTLFSTQNQFKGIINYLVLWGLMSLVIGIAIGLASAIFLTTLDFVTTTRINNPYLIYFFPVAGLITGFLFYYYGKGITKGVKLILLEYKRPNKKIPLKMAPMILLGTLVTHLFGGSAGREGTALQMGGSIADQFYMYLKPSVLNRKILLLMGLSAGFGSVFGTPFAGIVFAFELIRFKKVPFQTIFPTVLVAFIADVTCQLVGVTHHQYTFVFTDAFSFVLLAKVAVVGVLCGLVAILFIRTTEGVSWIAAKIPVSTKYYPFIGAIVFVALLLTIGNPKYMGLGIDTIAESFTKTQSGEVFLLKILFTALTLGVGFKGGEVTPLFFIGAAFGSFISQFVGLDLGLATLVGFIAVFSGATNAPFACMIMGVELFGVEFLPFLLIGSFLSYLVSGKKTIYN